MNLKKLDSGKKGMKTKQIISLLAILFTLPVNAQMFNFSLRTNNQQLIDKAIEGAFVKISQAYELCDTINDEHFGRNDKDYFSIVPFIGVETERGLIFPADALMPWKHDNDFDKYRERYKPLLTATRLSLLNNCDEKIRSLEKHLFGERLTNHLNILNDSTQKIPGLKIDSISGLKDGWIIWITSEMGLLDTDSIKYNSIKKEIEVPVDGESIRVDSPELPDKIYGGIYVTPKKEGIGQLSFTLTGVLISDDEGWLIDFPFIKAPQEEKTLTPIEVIKRNGKLNPLKRGKDETKK